MLKKHWIDKIQLALDFKREKFGKDAEDCMKFYNGPYTFMYGLQYRKSDSTFVVGNSDIPTPSFAMTVNKVAEMVQIFGPVLYHKNPIRQVNPRKVPQLPPELFGDPNDPQVQMMYLPMFQHVQQQQTVDKARAGLMSFYQNYTPAALDLKTHSRKMIDEAIIKGMGCLWTEFYRPRGANMRLVGSFYDTCDNLIIDPDCEELDDAKWIARRCVQPVWQVEQLYGLPKNSIKGTSESYTAQQQVVLDPDGDYRKRQGMSNDLCVYWKIYSKMGMGNRLLGTPSQLEPDQDFDRFGDFVHIALCETCDYPLNMPMAIWGDEQAMQKAVEWETPFWADDSWPVTPLSFHWVPRQVWPMSHLKPGMGELKALNWIYSFMVGKIRTICKDYICVAKGADEELKQTLIKGSDLELIELSKAHGDTINQVVSFLQHPQFNGEIWRVVNMLEELFEKRVGLTELAYGMSSNQLRSAQEANLKGSQLQIRPDDMSNKVEDAMSEAARKEAFMASWHLEAQDVAPVMGEVAAYWWQKLIAEGDKSQLLHQMEYRIESGSARKPNKDRDAANMNQAMQVMLPVIGPWAQGTGDVTAINALLQDWAKAIDISEPEKYVINPPAPPQGPSPEEVAAQAKQQEVQLQMQAEQQSMQMDAEKHNEDLRFSKQKHRLEIDQSKEKAKVDLELQKKKAAAQAAATRNGASK